MRSGVRHGAIRRALASWAAIFVTLIITAGAAAMPLSPSISPLPGSTAQGGDGNHTSAFGTVTVIKDLVPADDPGLFDLWIGDEVVRADASDGDGGSRELAPGNYAVFELAGTATDTADYDAEILCDNGLSGSPALAIVSIDANDEVTCTITNTRSTEPPPFATPEPTPTPTHTPEGSQAGGTGTPAPSMPNTALGQPGSGSLATFLFGTVLIGSLGALALANARGMLKRS